MTQQAPSILRRLSSLPQILSIAALLAIASAGAGCGSSTSSTASSSSTTTTTNAYVTAYKTAFGTYAGSTTATVTYPSSCTLSLTTTGVPTYHNAYYLVPVSTTTATVTTVAYSAATNSAMYLVPYTPASIKPQTVTVNICPSKAASTTLTSGGAIGFTLQGEAIYNAYEGNGLGTPAMSDNASYTFSTGGVSYTAYFIDQCNSHPTPLAAGYNWHHHGIPSCLISSLDTATGPSHLLGFALDGFPIYGGRDINGAVITASQLDACNGITSVTPEFSTPTYHYVLPLNDTSKFSSMNCYSGTVNATLIGQMNKKACLMKRNFAHWDQGMPLDMKKTMEMDMKDGSKM
jgi:hypothetical protein